MLKKSDADKNELKKQPQAGVKFTSPIETVRESRPDVLCASGLCARSASASSYTAEIADLAARYGVTLHSFADDNQLYIHCGVDDVHLSVADLERCVTAIGHWMSANRLKLNTDKQLIWTGTRSNLERIPGGGVSLTLGNDVIQGRRN